MSSRQRPPRSSATGRPEAWPTMSNSAISIAALASGWPTTAWSAAAISCLDAERVGADQQRPQIDVQRRGIGLDGAGEHRPRRGIAPAGDAGIGLELQDGVLHRARDVARAVAAHQAHRDVGDEDRHRRDLDLLQKALSPLPRHFPGRSLSRTMRANHNGETPSCAAICFANVSTPASRPSARTSCRLADPGRADRPFQAVRLCRVHCRVRAVRHARSRQSRPRLRGRGPGRHDQDRADAVHPPGDARDRLGLPERAVRRHPHRSRTPSPR